MKINVKTIIIFFILLLAIYQDFPLVNVFGEIARSPIVFLIPPMLYYIFSFQKIKISKYTRYFIYYLFYLVLVTIIYLTIVFYLNGSFLILRENIIIKSIKLFTYPISALIFYQFTYTFLSRGKDIFNSLFNAIFSIQLILAVYLFFEVIFLKTSTIFLSFLHSNSLKYYRVRLFTYEESWIGTILTFFVFVPVFLVNYLKYSKETKLKVYAISAFLFTYYTLVSESKGYLLLVLVSILPMTISYVLKSEKWRKIGLTLLSVVFMVSIFVFITLKTTIESQILTSITFGTR